MNAQARRELEEARLQGRKEMFDEMKAELCCADCPKRQVEQRYQTYEDYVRRRK